MKTIDCYAGCGSTQEIPNTQYWVEGILYFIKTSHWDNPWVCTSCTERLTSGRVSDGDAATNPDLNK